MTALGLDAEVAEHRIVSMAREDDLLTLWCACGWMTRTGSEADGLDFFDRHVGKTA